MFNQLQFPGMKSTVSELAARVAGAVRDRAIAEQASPAAPASNSRLYPSTSARQPQLFGTTGGAPKQPRGSVASTDLPAFPNNVLSDREQSKQLKMFMTPREIVEGYQPLQGDRKVRYRGNGTEDETNDELWSRKAREASRTKRRSPDGSSLSDSIAKDGVKSLVHLSSGPYGSKWGGDYDRNDSRAVLGGHHRIAASFVLNPDQSFLPVMHHTGLDTARGNMAYPGEGGGRMGYNYGGGYGYGRAPRAVYQPTKWERAYGTRYS